MDCSIFWRGLHLNQEITVRVVAYTKFLGVPAEMYDGQLPEDTDHGSDIARYIECAGRECYDSYKAKSHRDSASYHEHIKQVGHGSVTGHGEIGFYIGGISRNLSHELVRHGVGCEKSQRCLAGDTKIKTRTFARGKVSGATWTTLDQLYRLARNPTWRTRLVSMHPVVLDEEKGYFVTGKISDVVSSGRKPCFVVELNDGKTLTCTADHKIYTESGWLTLDEIASPRVEPNRSCVTWQRRAIRLATNGVTSRGTTWHDRDWLVEQLVTNRLKRSEVAKLAGCSPGTIEYWAEKHGIPSQYKARKHLYKDEMWLRQRYKVERRRLHEMAKESECSVPVLRKWLQRYGLQQSMAEICRGRLPWNLGKTYSQTKPYSPEAIEKYRQSKMGDKNPQWKGGVTAEPRRLFQSWKKQNKQTIFERDGYACRMCGRNAGAVPPCKTPKRKIEINHIMPIWNRPDLACDPGNMITLCWQCHVSLNHKEMQFAQQLLEAIKSPLSFTPSNQVRQPSLSRLRPKWATIKTIRFAGEIDTYDLVLEGPNHGFVANGIVVHNSTRYCSEQFTPIAWHPLLGDALQESDWELLTGLVDKCRHTYDLLMSRCEDHLLQRGVSKGTARKQARGAARGILPSALETGLIWTVNIRALRHILEQRCQDAADAEIRLLMNKVYLLAREVCPEYFNDYTSTPAEDGIGFCLKTDYRKI
jgi:thymidylate synthase (FAD)